MRDASRLVRWLTLRFFLASASVSDSEDDGMDGDDFDEDATVPEAKETKGSRPALEPCVHRWKTEELPSFFHPDLTHSHADARPRPRHQAEVRRR